jgi:transcription elongation factor Elf1
MKICDRCGSKPVTMILVDKKTDSEIDFCFLCANEFGKWKNECEVLSPTGDAVTDAVEHRKPGRPRYAVGYEKLKKDATN